MSASAVNLETKRPSLDDYDQYLMSPKDDWEARLIKGISLNLAPTRAADCVQIPDEALRRENLYEDRGA